MTPSALIVDDDASSSGALAERLARDGFETTAVDCVGDARGRLASAGFDLIILDLQLPDGSGLDLLPLIDENTSSEVVLITGHATVDSAVQAFRGGAVDYLTKPVDVRRLKKISRTVLQTCELRSQIADLRGELRQLGRFGKMVGSCEPMQRVYDLIERVAPTDATVFIQGETGTGKELAAEAIHAFSLRAKAPFLPINCGALTPTLIESELFGHERGSFTGADRTRRGVFERAHGGTLFLDEITEMPQDLQVKMLRVLEDNSVVRIGGETARTIDVRLIAATNRDPQKAVADGRLREDLLYRLLVFPLEMPALRERGRDVDVLTTHFLDGLNRKGETDKRVADSAFEELRAHSWPGNVRELKHVMERAYILAGDRIDAACLPLAGRQQAGDRADMGSLVGASIAETERRLVLATLERLGGDKKAAAEMLGISLKTLYNRLNTYRDSTHPAEVEE